MLKSFIAVALLSGFAFGETFKLNDTLYNVHRSGIVDKNVESFKKACDQKNGVVDKAEKIIKFYTCRTENDNIVGYFMPEQTIVLFAGDSKMFEKEVWGVN